MPILSIFVETTGQAGREPKIIYINTNDPISEVIQPNYLNQTAAQGVSFYETDIALVSTKSSPSAKEAQVNFFDVSRDGKNVSLILKTGGTITGGQNVGAGPGQVFKEVSGDLLSFRTITGTNIVVSTTSTEVSLVGNPPFDPAASYDGVSNPKISGNWKFIGPFDLNATGNVNLQSANGDISMLALGLGASASIQASENITLAAATRLTLSASEYYAPTMPLGANTNVLYINPATGELSQAPLVMVSNWEEVTTATKAMEINKYYIANFAGPAKLDFTLPLTCSVGSAFRIVGSSIGWNLLQNAGQVVHAANLDTTVGVGGSLTSIFAASSIYFVCTVADTEFVLMSGYGEVDVI